MVRMKITTEELATIKSRIKDSIGEEVFVEKKIGKQKGEGFNAVVDGAYSHVFVVKTITAGLKKSFTYVDVADGTVSIIRK